MKSASTYIPMDRRLALARGETLPDRSWGAVLFADISGFTPLTATLAEELGPRRGVEELTHQLNRIYGALIAEVHRYGGSVIGFSGDAITCWFDQDEGRQATACALAMQHRMRYFGQVITQNATSIGITIKVAVVTGPVRRFMVGEPNFRLIDVLAGQTLHKMAQAERLANSKEVIIAADVAQTLQPKLQIAQWRQNEAGSQRFAVVTELAELAELAENRVNKPVAKPSYLTSQMKQPALSEEEASAWLLPSVYERLQGSKGQFLAELRPAVALFLKFKGIDYDDDEDAGGKLDAFIDWVQLILSRYEGSLIQLTIGDKGSYLYAAFGVPVAHDDHPQRAVAAALALQTPPEHLYFIEDIRIGIAKGQMRTGAYGSVTRRTYGVLGDKVNLAARLMSLAQTGQVLCDYQTYLRTRQRWAFRALPAVRVKGKAGLIRVYQATGDQQTLSEEHERGSLAHNRCAMVGRKAELARLSEALQQVEGGQNQLLLISGEAGIGKSRLVAEFTRLRRTCGLTGLLGAGQNIEQHTPYRAWRDIFTTYFALSQLSDAQERKKRVRHIVQEVTPEQLARLPLLNDVLDLGFPDTPLTATLDPALRHKSLVAFLLALLQAWMVEQPLILVIEDAHWLDSLSWDLVVEVARTFMPSSAAQIRQKSIHPLLLMLVTRPLDDYSIGAQSLHTLHTSHSIERLALTILNQEEMIELMTAHLGLLVNRLPHSVAELVRTRAGGNPFFAEELLFTLRERGLIRIEASTAKAESDPQKQCVVSGDLALSTQTLPDTLHGLILSRIDRLPLEEQLTLKIAAVIGRTFAYTPLNHLVNRYTDTASKVLKTHLHDFVQHNLAIQDLPEPDLTYVFKHIITQEVTYQTLLFAQRRNLHQTVAEWYEQYYGLVASEWIKEPEETAATATPLSVIIPLLVHHYHHAEQHDKERNYAILAGKQAATQFAHVEAITYYRRALALTPDDEFDTRYEAHGALEAIYGLQGERNAQKEELTHLMTLARQMEDLKKRAEVCIREADYAEMTCDYANAIAAAQTAISLAHIINDRLIEATSYRIWGRALLRQGQYKTARDQLLRALQIIDEMASTPELEWVKGSTLHSLGLVVRQQGDYRAAKAYYEEALAIERAIGDRRGEGATLGNLGLIYQDQGDYEEAQGYYEQDLQITRTIGDRRGEGITLLHLGMACHAQGDYAQAQQYYEHSLPIRHEVGDRRGEGLVLAQMSLLYHHIDANQQAYDYAQRALTIGQQIGSLYVQAYALTFLAHAQAALGQLDDASTTYQDALTLRQEMGLPHLAMEALAGLARVALRQQQPQLALTHVQQILSYLATPSATLGGTEEPLRIYLTCYHVLHAHQEPSAQDILHSAHQQLQTRANKIKDESRQAMFLQDVRVHREIMGLRPSLTIPPRN